MSPLLSKLIELARGHVMTPQEKFLQRVSWVYGMQEYDAPGMTKRQVAEHMIDLHGYPTEWLELVQ